MKGPKPSLHFQYLSIFRKTFSFIILTERKAVRRHAPRRPHQRQVSNLCRQLAAKQSTLLNLFNRFYGKKLTTTWAIKYSTNDPSILKYLYLPSFHTTWTCKMWRTFERLIYNCSTISFDQFIFAFL